MLTKLILLLIYFLALFIIIQLLEISSVWFEVGCLASHFIDPFAQSVWKLKSLLDQRGVSYAGIVDKKELVELVEATGGAEEINQSGATDSNQELGDVATEDSSSITFNGASHFFEEVEDTKASAWVVQVVPNQRQPLLKSTQWSLLGKKLARFGIRTGTFRCSKDPRLCSRYNWYKSSIILSMPKGNKPKGNVMIKMYDSKPSTEHVFQWVNSQISSKVKIIHSYEEFKDNIQQEQGCPIVKVFAFTTVEETPMFLSSLSIQFTGRIKVIHTVVSKENKAAFISHLNTRHFSKIVLIKTDDTFVYGTRRGETLRYRTLAVTLRTFSPEVNDLFIMALIIVNLACGFEVFLSGGGILRRGFYLICYLVAYNTILIVIWLPLLGLFQMSYLTPVTNLGLKFIQSIMATDTAALLRSYCFFFSYQKILLFGSYVVFGLAVRWMRRKYKGLFGTSETDDAFSADWFTQDLNYFSHMVYSFPSLWRHQAEYHRVEDGLDLLIRRLAVPDIWLHPLIPTDFMRNLPIWKYSCCGKGLSSVKEETPTQSKEMIKCEDCEAARQPPGILSCSECVICLEEFQVGCMLLGLPCGHSFHQSCIEAWLSGGNIMCNYNCPVCRWPAYKSKPPEVTRREVVTPAQ